MNDYMLNGNDLYKISNNMGLEPVTDDNKKAQLKAAFARFKQKNNKLSATTSMVPDSLLNK